LRHPPELRVEIVGADEYDAQPAASPEAGRRVLHVGEGTLIPELFEKPGAADNFEAADWEDAA
jgi:hypothetical protein